MTTITAQMVKELREKTGAGMMACKNALKESNGDVALAEDNLAKAGLKRAAKSASRTAAEGIIVSAADDNGVVVILEVNSETDFVSRDDNFKTFCHKVADIALKNKASDVAELSALSFDGAQTVESARQALVSKIGENVQIRRAEVVKAQNNQIVGQYIHMDRIGVLATLEGGDAALAKDIAMQIAAVKPEYISQEYVAAERIEKEREIFTAQSEGSGKPAEIIAKMVEGRLAKFVNEICLVGQPYIKNPDQSVAQLLKERGATVTNYVRFEVGEGIEKEVVDFAEEVRNQVKGGA